MPRAPMMSSIRERERILFYTCAYEAHDPCSLNGCLVFVSGNWLGESSLLEKGVKNSIIINR